MTIDVREVWHRIEMVHYAAPVDEFDRPSGPGTVELVHRKYPVVKLTPKGAQLAVELGMQRLVLRDSKRQFASPTFAQAKLKFRKRKERHVAILKQQIRNITEALGKLDQFKQ